MSASLRTQAPRFTHLARTAGSRLFACLLALLSLSALAEEPAPRHFSSDGYRISLYRSPTPEHIDGAINLDPPQLQALLRQTPTPLLVDVYRKTWRHGRFVDDEEHQNIPGSLWLANTGDGELQAPWQDYLARHLQQATQGDKLYPIVFYCRSDCWLGWNAIRRAQALGYRTLYWLRDGIDGWQQHGLPLETAQPVAFP